MERKVSFAPGEFYHLYNRGTEKRTIFLSRADYERFLTLLYLCNSSSPVNIALQGRTFGMARTVNRGKPLVEISAYCLMPNHFHLIVREKEDKGISRFMQKLTTGYTMYFNARRKRTGALFQGVFKSVHANSDRYLSYLVAYVHLNPVKLIEPQWREDGIADRRRAEKYLQSYEYSSYPDYLGRARPYSGIIDKSALPEYFKTPKDFRALVTEWLDSERRNLL